MRSQTITPTMTTDTAIAAEDGAAPTLAYASRGAGITGMLSNVKVRTRLLLLAGVLGLLWALVVIFSMTGVGSVKHHDSTTNAYRALQTQAKSAYQGWLTEDDVMHIYASLAVIGTPAAKAEMKEMLAYIGSEHTASLRGLNAVIAGSSDPKVLADATKALAIIKSYEAFVSQVKAQVAAGHVINADNIAAVHYLAAATQVSTAFTALSARLQALVDAGASNVSSSIANTKTLLWIVTGISILIGVLALTLIIRSITGPLGRLAEAAKRFARGAVDIDLDVHGKDELATVADSFREAISAQKQVASNMVEFSTGHIGVQSEPRSEDDVLGHAFVQMQQRMREALGEHATTTQLDAGMSELLQTLQSLDQGLTAMTAGDLTVAVDARLAPVTAEVEGESIGFVAERYNEMIASAKASLDGYNAMRETLREKLGDHSSLEALTERLESLTSSCLADLQRAMRAMNDGDLTISVTPSTSSITADAGMEIGHLAEVFNATLENTRSAIQSYNDMRAKIAEMLGEISQSSESLSAASSQMASTSEEAGRAIAEIANAVGSVAQGAEQQVREVDGAKRITEELAEASRLSAEAADETAAAADEARSLAREGVSAAEDASSAIKAVRDSSEGASDAIRSLGEKSDQIGGIVATITGIAAQTNLLALNAAIEAARAGEHGRGFAVVAEEVRHLAEESQAAAATIGALIEEIQHETQRAVEVVELGANQTRSGVETVEQAKDAFLQIGQSVEDMSGRVEQIAASIRQIAASGDQMRESMNTVAAVAESSSASTEEVSASTEQTTASTEQIAANAQQLATTADELERLVGQFVLA
jgi:methyl-accepting chemotaxis protein